MRVKELGCEEELEIWIIVNLAASQLQNVVATLLFGRPAQQRVQRGVDLLLYALNHDRLAHLDGIGEFVHPFVLFEVDDEHVLALGRLEPDGALQLGVDYQGPARA